VANDWLGVLGGGQLGRMFCHAAQKLGFRVCVLDPTRDGPAGCVAERQIVAAYDDPEALAQLGQSCRAVTTEFENVPARSLAQLAANCPVRPDAQAVAVAQDRAREKAFLRECGVEVAPHVAIVDAGSLEKLDESLFPAILKTSQLGYDGKGQRAVAEPGDVRAAWEELGRVRCVLERRLPLRRELSVIVARGADGATAVFPVVENEHRGGILAVSTMPARVSAQTALAAQGIALRVAAGLSYVGVLCVELFELDDGRLFANEMAPRPHNSGHATIDACAVSQFEQQARVLAGLPLGEPRLLAPAVMLNLLGEIWFARDGSPREPAFDQVLAVPGACLHLYGKHEARRGRKMGHVTILGETVEDAHVRAARVARILGIEPPFQV